MPRLYVARYDPFRDTHLTLLQLVEAPIFSLSFLAYIQVKSVIHTGQGWWRLGRKTKSTLQHLANQAKWPSRQYPSGSGVGGVWNFQTPPTTAPWRILPLNWNLASAGKASPSFWDCMLGSADASCVGQNDSERHRIRKTVTATTGSYE